MGTDIEGGAVPWSLFNSPFPERIGILVERNGLVSTSLIGHATLDERQSLHANAKLHQRSLGARRDQTAAPSDEEVPRRHSRMGTSATSAAPDLVLEDLLHTSPLVRSLRTSCSITRFISATMLSQL